VSDGEHSSTATVNIVVTAINDAPYFVTSSLDPATEDEEYTVEFEINDIDSDNTLLNIEEQYLPSWLTLSGNILSGTPTLITDDQSLEIILSITDDEGATSTENFVLGVIAINNSPTAYSQSAFLLEDESLEIYLIGSDPEGDSLTFSLDSDATIGSLLLDGNIVTYIPNIDFSGSDSFTFNVIDVIR
jgi:hypothetical protein